MVSVHSIMDDKSSLPNEPSGVTGIDADALRIRPMTIADIDRVHLIDQLSFNMPWPIKSYHYELTENKASLLNVGEFTLNDGTPLIVAMIVTWLIVDEAHIATIAVHPTYRRLGIGKKILSAALLQAIDHGAKSATLEVRQGNHIAIDMYDQFGFKIVGQRPRYYHDTKEDALIMTVKGLDQEYLNWLQAPESGPPPVMED